MEHKGGIHSKTEALSVSVYNPDSANNLVTEPHDHDVTMSAIIISVSFSFDHNIIHFICPPVLGILNITAAGIIIIPITTMCNLLNYTTMKCTFLINQSSHASTLTYAEFRQYNLFIQHLYYLKSANKWE